MDIEKSNEIIKLNEIIIRKKQKNIKKQLRWGFDIEYQVDMLTVLKFRIDINKKTGNATL